MTSLIGSLRRKPRNATSVQRETNLRTPMTAQATGLLSYLTNNNDPDEQIEQYGRSGTLHATAKFNAGTFSMIDCRLFRHSDGRGRISGPDPRREVTQHAALDLLNRPNQFMTGQFYKWYAQLHIELTGKSFTVGNFVHGIPTDMWPISPGRMTPVPDPKAFLLGWVYTGPDGTMVPLKTSEVLWFRQPHPGDLYDGMGAVQPMMPDVLGARAISEWQRNFFKNSAQPGGFVSFPERISDEQWDELTERWEEQHRGVNRAHRVAFLESGGAWTPAGYNMKDMELSDMRQDGRDTIYEGMSTSKGMLGVVEDVNRSNIEGSEYIYSKYKMGLTCAMWKGVLNTDYLAWFGGTGQGVEFDFDDTTPKDWQADAATTAANAAAAGILIDRGFNPESTLDAMSLPAIKFDGKPVAPPPPPPPMPPMLPPGNGQGDPTQQGGKQ